MSVLAVAQNGSVRHDIPKSSGKYDKASACSQIVIENKWGSADSAVDTEDARLVRTELEGLGMLMC